MRLARQLKLLSFLLFIHFFCKGQQTITTIAGGAARNGEGKLASNAQLLTQSISVDGLGNLYWVDIYESSVRRMAAQSGILSTIAGNGTPGYSGDNGLAIQAQLDPVALTVDAAGDIYVADVARVRKVAVATGFISTVAGNGIRGSNGNNGASVNAQISPNSVSVDGSGNFYIVEGNQIRRVAKSTGIITLFAGNAIAGSIGDNGLATLARFDCLLDGKSKTADCDKLGNLYIADYGNNRIRKVDVSTNIVTTIAGNGSDGYTGDGGLAINAQLKPISLTVDQSSNTLYFLDGLRIRTVNLTSGIIRTIAGNGNNIYSGDDGAATDASFQNPTNLSTDPEGNVYVTDDNRIRKINTKTGIITRVAGTGKYGFSEDNGSATESQILPFAILTDANGNVIFNDGGARIRRINSNTGKITTLVGDGTLGYGGDNGTGTAARINCFEAFDNIAIDKNGTLYIADRSNSRIRRLTTSGIITTIAGNGQSGFAGDNGPAINARISSPNGIATDRSGNIYFSDTQNHRIRRINAGGTINTIAGNGTSGFSGDNGPATAARLFFPASITVDEQSNLYILEGRNRVRKVDLTTGVINTIAGQDQPGFEGDGGQASQAKFDYPSNITVDRTGNIYIADQGNNRIRKIHSGSGIITTLAGYGALGFSGDNGIGAIAQLYYPTTVVVDESFNLYFTDQRSYRIRKIINANIGNDQAILMDKLNTRKFTDPPFNLNAITTSGLPVTYASSNTNVATVNGNLISIVGAGETLITASQEGTSVYNAAANVTQPFLVEKANQTFLFENIESKVLGDPPFTFSVSNNSGLPIELTSALDNIVVDGNTITLKKAGSATIRASVPGNSNFNPASSSYTFCINPAKPTFTVKSTDFLTWTLTSSSSFGNEWYLNSNLVSGQKDQVLKFSNPSSSGNYTVRVRVDNCVSEASAPQAVIITGEIRKTKVELFPNPSQSKLTLQIPEFDEQGETSLQIIDLNGKTVDMSKMMGINKFTIDISHLSTGTYIILATQKQRQVRRLFVKE
jgi:trimeric autotransporter adhesin